MSLFGKFKESMPAEQPSIPKEGIELSETEKEKITQRITVIEQRIEEIKAIRTDEDKWNKLEDAEAQKLFEEYNIIKDEREESQRKLEGKSETFIYSPEELNKRVVDTLVQCIHRGVNEDYVAEGLVGVGTSKAMEVRRELLPRALSASRSSLARGLAGVGTSEAMEFRKELLKRGTNKGDIALGLAGVGTLEAIKFRMKLLKQGANEDYVAESLVGVGTSKAMELRKKMLKRGVDETSFAISLAGVDTPEAMQMRNWLALKQRAESADFLIPLGLTGVGTSEAMEMRKRLLTEQKISKKSVALGLAGVGTPEAMQMRKDLLEQGTGKDIIAQSLAGVLTDEAMEFRKEHLLGDPDLLAQSFYSDHRGIDGVVCKYGYEE